MLLPDPRQPLHRRLDRPVHRLGEENPLDGVERLKAAGASEAEIAAERENIRFAWRPMEAGRRLQDLLTEFALTIQSPRFTPEFLNLFLRTYRQHADHILHNYSKQGNHLLFEAQRMLFAGIYFPEFREAAEWRRSGIEILNREIGVQVYPDGMQFELDFGYHIAAIDIFLKALGMARQNGFEAEFPASYIETVGKMTTVTWNLLFPDYSNPMFGDTKSHDKASLKKQFANWSSVFPDDRQYQWFATEGRKGGPSRLHLAAVPRFGILRPAHGMGHGCHRHGRQGRAPGLLAQPARQRNLRLLAPGAQLLPRFGQLRLRRRQRRAGPTQLVPPDPRAQHPDARQPQPRLDPFETPLVEGRPRRDPARHREPLLRGPHPPPGLLRHTGTGCW